jgi:hypothetical protein
LSPASESTAFEAIRAAPVRVAVSQHGFVGVAAESLQSFHFHELEALYDTPSRFSRKTVIWQSSEVFLEAGSGFVEKIQLAEIPLAPRADEEMQPHLAAQFERPRLFQRAG